MNTLLRSKLLSFILVGATFASIGSIFYYLSHAETPFVSAEVESGTLAGCVSKATDGQASGGAALAFGSTGNCPGSGTAKAGATLPITYNLSSLSGTARYVATTGSDTSGNGSVTAPFATVSKAYSAAANGDPIVVRGGTYRQGGLSISAAKSVKIIAYPGETPIFNGAEAASGGWTAEGSLSYRAYTPIPVTDGSGISFSTGQNLTGDGVGKFPDQAWVGAAQLQQVSAKAAVAAGKFWVDTNNKRIYLMASQAGQAGVEVSQQRTFLTSQAPNTSLEGIRVTRFSNTASDYGVIKFLESADNSVMRNVEVSDTAFIAVFYGGNSNLHNGSRLQNVTVATSNWMGVSATYTDNLTLDAVNIRNMNQFNEFTHSPQSGALKTSRTRYTSVLNSEINNNNSHGLWFDQSNQRVDVANNQILDNAGSGLFFEISDDLLLINNYIRSTGGARAVKLAGSSGLKLINNTIVGGADPIGIYVDNRSKPGCANPAAALCANSYGSDRDTVRPYSAAMDWIPRLDLMLNNIVAYQTSGGYCGTTTMCITSSNADASVPLSTVIHKADASRGTPQTRMDGDVFANGSGQIINTASGNFTSTAAFGTAMASAVGISGLEANGKVGNSWVNPDGSPTAALAAAHGQAIAIPSDARINQYLPANSKHYGVTYK